MNIQEFKNLSHWFKSTDIRRPKRGKVLFQEWYEGRYQIDYLLGYGHTSIVFRATDTRLERDVAIKVWIDTGYFEQSVLLKEGKLLAQLQHPNIVKVLDYGLDSNLQRPWIVLEYLGSTTLFDFIKIKGGLKGRWELLVKIGIQLSNIIDYLHNSSYLLQLDIKPGNLALEENNWKIKLMDLGSAFLSNEDHIDRLGTPGYIAPEVFSKHPFTHACDIFSFGMLLYELITGKNPLISLQKEALPFTEDAFDFITAAIPISRPINGNENKAYHKLLEDMAKFDLRNDLNELETPSSLIDLIESMCSFDTAIRPNAYEVRNALNRLLEDKSRAPMPSIFISHSHLDKYRFVKHFAEKLEELGCKVWLDEKSLRVGEPFWERIGSAIESSDFVIVILSHNSINSNGVSEEIRTAQLQNLDRVKILPIRIDPINYSDVPINLRSRHILDFVGWETGDGLEKKTKKLSSDIISLINEN